MSSSRRIHSWMWLLLAGSWISLGLLPALADEKQGMPDLPQTEQTCLPTSTANLIIWFGKHGYPKLILPGEPGDTEADRERHTLNRLMADTNARYDLGTQQDKVTSGIEKYIREAGYGCTVEYRGIDWSMTQNQGATATKSLAFNQDWLKENDEPNKGFILLLAYCNYNRASDTFSSALNSGHAVTLVNAESDMILVHDPAHESDETGRKILTPTPIMSGAWEDDRGFRAPVTGMMLLSGSLMYAPPKAGIMLTGAVCITMHPISDNKTPVPVPVNGPTATVAGNGVSSPGSVPKPVSPSSSWTMWLFNYFFKS